jgi:hypothetical protein
MRFGRPHAFQEAWEVSANVHKIPSEFTIGLGVGCGLAAESRQQGHDQLVVLSDVITIRTGRKRVALGPDSVEKKSTGWEVILLRRGRDTAAKAAQRMLTEKFDAT